MMNPKQLREEYKKLEVNYFSEKRTLMHSIHLTSHINKNGLLTVQLPQEWAEQEVDVVLKLGKTG